MTPADSLAQFATTFDRASIADHCATAESEREMLRQAFPRESLAGLPVEKYAMGLGGNDSLCWTYEFGSDRIGSIKGGSVFKFVLWFGKDGQLANSAKNEEPDTALAWQKLRAGLVRSLELCEAGNFAETDAVPFARLAPALRVKMQHVFFPSEVLPIFSCGHLEHFLAQLGVTWKRDREKDRYTATANRLLLSELRKLPTLADWTPTELERLLYTWNAPTREPAKEPIAEFAKRFNRSALADAAREAWLYARRLLRQLALGGPHEYMERSDDLPLVRGRIHFVRQATTLFCRPDIVACDWAEFSPDTPLARLLRCAAEVLLARTRLPGAAADLRDAISILEETESVRAKEALSGAAAVRWSRMNERWRACYELAVAALSGLGRELHAGDTESFVFLLDMNFLFESYCGRWLERKFAVAVSEQKRLGHLLKTPQSCGQKPDFQWRHGGSVWVGDAKYKQRSGDDWPQIADIRQLICYGRLAEQIHAIPSRLTLLYPTLNAEVQEVWTTFENQPLELRAVRVVK